MADNLTDRRAAPAALSWSSPAIILAYLITLGFFAALYLQMTTANSNPDMMVGALIAAFSGIVGYFFGTSSSSAKKDETIDKLSATAATVATTAQATQVAAAAGAQGAPVKTDAVNIDAQDATINVTTEGKP